MYNKPIFDFLPKIQMTLAKIQTVFSPTHFNVQPLTIPPFFDFAIKTIILMLSH
jgi:hypothetical protein